MAKKITRVRITPGIEEGDPLQNDRLLSPASVALILIFGWIMATYYAGKYGWEYVGLHNTADLPPAYTTDIQPTPTP